MMKNFIVGILVFLLMPVWIVVGIFLMIALMGKLTLDILRYLHD